MNSKLITLLFFAFFSFLSANCQEPVNHLKKEISLQLDEAELRDILPKIGEAANFQFSYNAAIIPGDSLVAVDASNKKVQLILEDLLGQGIRYKVLGNHVILLAEDTKQSQRGDRNIQYTISGYIYDALSGDIISEASIYEVDERLISATNNTGYYSLTLPSDQEKRMVSYSKTGYNDTVIVVRPSDQASIDIRLFPKQAEINGSGLKALPPDDVHERTLVAALVPGKAIIASENIPVIEERFMQVSFLPFIGSNHVVSGLLTNRLSLNILAGYSEGVRGFELGGLFNIDRNNVKGIQIGGLGNIVGKDTRGIQVAGLFNVNGGSLDGLQVAGLSNLVMDTIRGVQLAGFVNALRGAMYGPQISGFANFTSQNVDGAQISGFTNIALKDVRAGQVSGFANYAKNVGGVQAAGFANIVSGTNNGIQAAGFMNFAREVNGYQLSVFNFSDTVSSGVPVGFLSFVRKGYHTVEFSTDEFFRANMAFKTGVRKFYNILSAGVSEEWLEAGYGIGSQLRFSDKWKMSFDLTSSYVLDKARPAENSYMHFKFSPKLDFKVFKYLTLTAGPSLNLFGDISTTSSDYNSPSLLFSYPLEGFRNSSSELQMWIGGSIGFRF